MGSSRQALCLKESTLYGERRQRQLLNSSRSCLDEKTKPAGPVIVLKEVAVFCDK